MLFILCDDLRPDALGCFGSKHVKTPHIDRLASEGVRFDNSFCTTSLCSPSRASILSGLYAHTHGVTNNFTEYPNSMPSFPGMLHDAGYATAYFGKYHMGENNDDPRPGFDRFVTHKGQGSYFDTEWNLNGKERKVIPGYYTTVVTDLALDRLKQQSTDKPWCAFIGHKAPHSFYTPEPKYEHAFDDVRVPYPSTAFHLDDKFTKILGGQFYIGVMRPDGSAERILSSGFLVDGATWAPNGRVLMFYREERSGAGSHPHLYSIDITGRNERAVKTPVEVSDPAWSPLIP